MRFFASLNWRRVLMIIGTLLIAFACGHFMQSGFAGNTPVATTTDGPDAGPILRGIEEPPELPVPPAATLTPIRFERMQPSTASHTAWVRPLTPPDDIAQKPQGAPCRTSAIATPRPAGLLRIDITAPCLPNTRVLLQHHEISVDLSLDESGALRLDLPVLDDLAIVDIRFADQTTTRIEKSLPGVNDLYRAALIWKGPQFFSLHALEYGAKYGERGHVSALAPKSPDRAARGAGGYLVRLGGETGGAVEIYTFPREDAPARGVVQITAEAVVTEETCETTALAKIVQTSALGSLMTSDVSLAMPDCSAAGDIVVLKNLFKDLRLAGR